MMFTQLLKVTPLLLVPAILVAEVPSATVAQVQGATPVLAQTPKPRPGKRVVFQPRKNQKTPERTVGGGRRNDNQCPVAAAVSNTPNQESPLLAVVPKGMPGTTLAANPSILVYVPPTPARVVELSVKEVTGKDQEDKELYQTMFDLPGKSGVVSFTLPKTEVALEVGKTYKWILTLVCDRSGARPEDPYVEGLIQRIQLAPTVIKQLESAKGIDRAVLYASEGVWYETVNQLARLLQSQPTNAQLTSDWQALLKVQGLEAIANAPLQTKD